MKKRIKRKTKSNRTIILKFQKMTPGVDLESFFLYKRIALLFKD